MIKIGQFLPDQPPFQSAGATVAKNVVPAANGYTSLPDVLPLSGAANKFIRGMFAAKDDAASAAIYVGDEDSLYKFSASDSSLTDISKTSDASYSTGDGYVWRFVQFGEEVIATNYSDPIQTITAAAGGRFADLGGSPPKAKFIAVVRDFVMCGYTNDTTDGEKPYRVRWSGIGDYDSWAVDADTQADFQDISDMGAVTGLVGGEYATILMEKGVVRAQYVGSPLVFEFDKVQLNRGCKISGSIASLGRNVFYLSDDGFYMFDGQSSKPIGAEKVNRYFLSRFQSNNSTRMSAVVDPLRQVVVWSYASVDSGDGTPDELIIYNYATDSWSTANIGLDAMAPLFTAGYTLENLANISSVWTLSLAHWIHQYTRAESFSLLVQRIKRYKHSLETILMQLLRLVSLSYRQVAVPLLIMLFRMLKTAAELMLPLLLRLLRETRKTLSYLLERLQR